PATSAHRDVRSFPTRRSSDLDEQKLSDIYSNLGCGVIDGYEVSVNEYLILKNLDSTVADVRKWNGEEFIEVKPRNMPSMAWGSGDRKSTRLNSSHVSISYAVF